MNNKILPRSSGALDALSNGRLQMICLPLVGTLLGYLFFFHAAPMNTLFVISFLLGLAVGIFSVSILQGFGNIFLSLIGFVLGLTLTLVVVRALFGVENSKAAGFGWVMSMASHSAQIAPATHVPWLLAVPLGYALRKYVLLRNT